MKLNRIISLLLCVLIIMTAAFPAAAEGDEVQAAKKIISVVYDDSGSMKGDRWVYANYATQALIALLNEQDELYLTYMSSPSKAEKVDLGNIEKVIQNIQNWNHTGSTPGQAIDTAWEKQAGEHTRRQHVQRHRPQRRLHENGTRSGESDRRSRQRTVHVPC